MSEYNPDAWSILKIESKDGAYVYRIIGGWYGGFAGSNSWKLSSSISGHTHIGHCMVFNCMSGSTYICHEDSERMNMLMSSIYADLGKDGNVALIEYSDFVKEFCLLSP